MVEVVEVSKASLRSFALQERKKIKEKDKLDILIKKKVLENIHVKNSHYILIYISKNLEVDTYGIIEDLLRQEKILYAPRIENGDMNFYQFRDLKELKLGKFQIFEPTSSIIFKNQENSCMIVPGLLFDKNYNRLGYGGGYYDKFLKNKTIYKIGICYSQFKIDSLETDPFDIPVDFVITER